jgi:adenylate cyclase
VRPELLLRLRERKIAQWALAYLAGAWLVLQVTDILGDQFGWPAALIRSITVLLGIGLAATLVLAWYHGEQGRQQVSGPELLMLGALLLIAGLAVTRVARDPELVSAAAHAPAWVSTAEAGSIAVLPFANLSDDREQEYFSDGLTEELLNALAQIPELRVAARTSSFAFKGQNVAVREIASQLAVTHVLEGSVRRSGDRLRITAQLIDARDGYQLWSQTYERERADVFLVQDEISRAIVEQLRLRLARDPGALVTAATSDLDAWEMYLKGLHFLGRRQLPLAIENFEAAVRLDPEYARAWAALAESYALLAPYADAPTAAVRAQGLPAANTALRLDPSLAEAHAALGFLALLELDWAASERALRRALELDPRSARALFYYALCLGAQGRLVEGAQAIQRSRQLDPLSLPVNAIHGAFLRDLGQLAAAEAHLLETLELDPTFALTALNLSATYERMGRHEEAVHWLERAAELLPNAVYRTFLGRGYAVAGRPADARRILAELETAAAAGRHVSPAGIAGIHIALGNRDEGFTWLARGVNERDVMIGVFWQMSMEWVIAPYRADPRFRALREKAGLAP